ncbi:MAG: DUF1858 domain-containing protein [Candidatus Anstonellales archaeon]
MASEIAVISFALGVLLIAYVLYRILFRKTKTEEYKIPEYHEFGEEESIEEVSETIKKMGKGRHRVVFEKPEYGERERIHEPRVEVKEYIKPSDKLYDVLEKYPQLLEDFVEAGIKGVQNPVVRKAFGKRTTIAEACKQAKIDFEEFVYKLNKKLTEEGG